MIKSCLDNHKKCNAECCKMIYMGKYEVSEEGKYFYLNPKLNFDMIRYFKFHGVDFIRGKLRFRKDRIKDGVYHFPCKMLENNRCKLHGTGLKPRICRELTLETKDKFTITENCLFKFKEAKE